MTRGKGWWLAAIESYPCPTCGAGPGDPCLTYTGNEKNEPHVDRGRVGDRCTQCGSRIHANSDGPLCDRCELVRSLEVERSTRWIRKDTR